MLLRKLRLGVVPLVALICAGDGHTAPPVDLTWSRIAAVGDSVPGGVPGDVFEQLGAPIAVFDGTVYFGGDGAIFRWTEQGGATHFFAAVAGAEVVGSDPPLSITSSHELGFAVSADGTVRVTASATLDACPGESGGVLLSSDGTSPFSVVVQTGQRLSSLGSAWHLIRGIGVNEFAPETAPVDRNGEFAAVSRAEEDEPCGTVHLPRQTEVAVAGDASGSLYAVAAAGDEAPGIPGAPFTSGFSIEAASNGQRLLLGRVRLGPSGPIVYGFFRWTESGGLELRVRQGQPAPGGGVISAPDSAHLSADGDLYFVNEESGSTGPIYRSDASGNLHEIHRIGMTAPGPPEGSVFSSYANEVHYGGPGELAFVAEATTPMGARAGIWTFTDGGSLLLRVIESEPLADPQARGFELIEYAPGGRMLYRGPSSDGTTRSLWVSDASGASTEYRGDGIADQFSQELGPQPYIDLGTDALVRTLVASAYGLNGAAVLFATALPEPHVGATAVTALLAITWIGRTRRWR